jgi:hypothetical protein
MAKRYGAEYWRRHLAAWHQSEQTQEAYCLSQGLSLKSFYRWRRKEKEAIAANPSLTLVPVKLGTPLSSDSVRLHSPGGWRIELPVGEAPWLAELLRQLP